WVITQLDAEMLAPTAITVTWANGQTLDVQRSAYTGKTAHYATTLNLDSPVVTAVSGAVPAGWSGTFNLSHGPCFTTAAATAVPTNTVAPTSTAMPTSTVVPTSTTVPTSTSTAAPTSTNTAVPAATAATQVAGAS